MNNLRILILIIITTLISCNFKKNGITSKIKNSSNESIINVTFLSDENSKLEFSKIEPNQFVEEFLDMTNNHKGDGAYKLKFERENGKKEQIIFGYYTNGVALNREVFCEIKNDTVLIKFNSIKY
ncbi:MAG: hypothetical protein P8M76_00650 [Flavobacteriaceae bacterium]|nr:hypothetical protein [Flavobacteriaceae bacterium]